MKKDTFYYVVMTVFALTVSVFGSFLQCTTTSKGVLACSGMLAVLSRNYELAGNQLLPPYLAQPLEYPFVSGFIFWVVQMLASLFRDPELGFFVVAPILTGMASVSVMWFYRKLSVPASKTLILWVLMPVVLMGGEFEFFEAALFMAGLYVFTKKQNPTLSAMLLGLSSGVKYLPLLTLPAFASQTKNRWKFSLIWVTTFALGMVAEFALSPVNFYRQASFYSTYGIEGSWIGLVFGHVINYTTQTTWYIGNSTTIHLPQIYQIVSFVLVVIPAMFVYRAKIFDLTEKCFLIFSILVINLWISAPQFLILVVMMLPLMKKFDWKYYPFIYFSGILSFFPFVVFVAAHSLYTAAYYLQVASEVELSVVVVWYVLERYAERRQKIENRVLSSQ